MANINRALGRCRRMGAGTAIAVAFMTLGITLPGTAAAATLNYDIAFDPAKLVCGSFGTRVICAQGQAVAPVRTFAGDTIKIHLRSATPIVIPGSTDNSLVHLDAYDASATLGPGGPGPIKANYVMTPLGLVGKPLTFNTGVFSRSYDYLAVMGNCCGLSNTGFSITGADATLSVVNADLSDITGVSMGYGYTLAAAPTTYSDLVGGTASSPLILPLGYISQINGVIGGAGPSDQFYNFNWGGGIFQSVGNVSGAALTDTFAYELFDSSHAKLASLWLNSDNSFNQLMSINLAAGHYTIGLAANAPIDPSFMLKFLTPIGGVPEPSTWLMMILGFGAIGVSLRRYRLAA